MTEGSNLLKEAEPICIDIGRRELSIDSGCELREISGHVRVSTGLPEGQLQYLRIARSPGLQTLDLSACPGGFDLEIDGASQCRRVTLPPAGCMLLLSVTEGFPVTRFFGPVRSCHVQCAAGHPVHGYYRIEQCDGLALLPGDALQPRRNIECYLRIDQSRRGLQLKRLRPRMKPEEAFWRPFAAREQAAWVPGQLTMLPPQEFSRLVLAQDADAALRRRELLADEEANRDSLRQLVRLHRRGYSPAALWAWRCMLDRAGAGEPHPERPGRAVLTAAPGIHRSTRSYEPPQPTFGMADLRLMLLCRPSGLVRRQQRRLLKPGEPLALSALVTLAATLVPGHDWWRLLVPMAQAAMTERRRVARLRSEEVDPADRGAWLDLTCGHSGSGNLREILACANRVIHPGLRERLFDHTLDTLGARKAVDLGVALFERGLPIGRDLVAAGLQGERAIGQSLHARAMWCLMAP